MCAQGSIVPINIPFSQVHLVLILSLTPNYVLFTNTHKFTNQPFWSM